MPVENMDAYTAKAFQTLVLLFGPPKTGKTRSLVTLLKFLRSKGAKGPLWLFDIDDGAASLINAAKAQGFKGDDIFVYSYRPKGGDKIGPGMTRPRGQGRDIYMEMIKDFNTLWDNVDPSTGQWKAGFNGPCVIAFDSASGWQDVFLDFILVSVGHDLGAPGTDARSDFGKAMQKTVECIQSCRGLPCVSVWTAHERLDKNEITSEIRIDPHFTGLLAATIAKEFGVVLYSTTKTVGQDTQYVWYTKPSGFVKTAGTRHHEGLAREVAQDYALVL